LRYGNYNRGLSKSRFLDFRCANFLALLFLLCGRVLAQDDLTAVPNRPTVSTPAQPVQPGVLETEWGVDAAASHQDVDGLFKFGVSTNFELRFANNPFIGDSGMKGFGDSAIGFKYRFLPDTRHQPSMAFMYMAKLPTASGLLGSGEIDHSFALLASKDLGKHHVDFNVIANLLGRPQGGFDRAYLYALAWSHPLHRKLGATAEISGQTPPNGAAPGTAQFLASATYTIKPRLVLDFGMAARVTGAIPKAIFIAGFTYSIADLYHQHTEADPAPKIDRRSSGN
jgi:hypothetical protein